MPVRSHAENLDLLEANPAVQAAYNLAMENRVKRLARGETPTLTKKQLLDEIVGQFRYRDGKVVGKFKPVREPAHRPRGPEECWIDAELKAVAA